MLRRTTTPKYQIDRSRSKKTVVDRSLQRLDSLAGVGAQIHTNKNNTITTHDTQSHGLRHLKQDGRRKDHDRDDIVDGDDDDDNKKDDNDNEPQDDEPTPPTSRGTRRRASTTRRGLTPTAKKTKKTLPPPPRSSDGRESSEDEESADDDDDIENDGDDTEDEDFVPTRTSRAASKRKGRGKNNNISNNSNQSSSDDDGNQGDEMLDSDDEEIVGNTKKRRMPIKKTTGTKSRRQSKVHASLDDFIVDEDEEMEEYHPVISTATPRRGTSTRRGTGAKQARRKIDNPTRDSPDEDTSSRSDFDDGSVNDDVVQRPAARRIRTVSTALRKESIKSSKELVVVNASRPRRSSASRAAHKLKQLNDSVEEDDDDEEEAMAPKRRKSPAREMLSSDEEFLADSASERSDEKEIGYTDSEDDASADVETSVAGRTPTAVNIDHDDIGSADDSSGNELKSRDPEDTPSTKGGRWDEIRPSPSHPHHLRDYDSSDDESTRKSSPFQFCCPSTEDAITLESLPQIHVCYISPDGNSRQCFAIETLRQITLKSSLRVSRTAIDGSQQDTFLQPPHFRTPMSADLLDQIASRFGRDALDLHGPFFNRQVIARSGTLNSDNYLAVFGESRQDYGEQFQERVTKYINGLMGSRDVYCCCLCYSEMHRRIVQLDVKRQPGSIEESGSQSSDDEEFLKLAADSKYDPMTVLGWLDNDKYAAASCFCFGKVASLKRHLREDHEVQTKGITGNDLYQRYRVRGTDGLLQRYLHGHWKRHHHTTFQGSMQRYWFDGANQSFVCLLEMIDRAEAFRAVLDDRNSEDDIREGAESFFQVAKEFFDSFQNRAKMEWEQISSPFQKNAQKDDLRDFLADEDSEDVVEEEYPPFLAHRRLQQDEDSDPNDLVHKLERKYAGDNPHGSSSSDDDISVSSMLNRNGYYSEEETEQKDEWIASIQKKRRKSLDSETTSNVSKGPKETPRGKKLIRRKYTTPLSQTTARTPGSTITPTPRRRAIEESSSEEEFV
jgi:hypothetical protein